MEAKVTWKGKMAFDGVGGSGKVVPLDSDVASGGDDRGARPMELLAIGLAGCTAMDVISILKKKQQDVTAFEVKVHADRAEEYPQKFTHITLEYVVSGHHVEQAAVARAVELSETKYCSAYASLRPGAEIDTKITVLEA
jgi:putative redox protein